MSGPLGFFLTLYIHNSIVPMKPRCFGQLF